MSNNKSAAGKKSKFSAITKKMDTKNNLKNSGIETLKDLLVGVVGGGLAGAAIGKPSLLVGIGTSLIGHYMESSLATSFGLGMMASGGYQMALNGKSVSGLEGAKERVKAFGDNLKQRFYLDKIIKPKQKDDGANGMGNVKYFKYPSGEEKPLDLGALDNIEREIARSGEDYARQQMQGTYDDISGVAEKLY